MNDAQLLEIAAEAFEQADGTDLASGLEAAIFAVRDALVAEVTPPEGWKLHSIIPKSGSRDYICMIHTMNGTPFGSQVRMEVGEGASPNEALADAIRQALEEPTDG